MSEIRPLTEREKVCLSCSLDICDDRSKECKFVQLQPKRQMAVKIRKAEYQATYYQRNRERILARWHATKPPSREERRKQNALG